MFSVLVATATLIDGFAAGLYVGLKLKNVNLKKTIVEVVKEVQADVQQIEQTLKQVPISTPGVVPTSSADPVKMTFK